jgi:saccharopine dehydrogenase (NAD+, L-lysine-forming)
LACAGYLRAGLPQFTLVAVDRGYSAEATQGLQSAGVRLHCLDLLADRDAFVELLRSADIVVNLAGPFYRLGTAVLDAAIDAGISYLDICDDVDATEALLARHGAAVAGGCRAIINMGSAPGTTNLLVKLALEYLKARSPAGTPCHADIAWCAPDSDLTPGIFAHLVHCFRTALPGGTQVPAWGALQPRAVLFPDPIGSVEVVQLGHPEPLTLARYLDCPSTLRGGMTSSGLLRQSWELARQCDAGRSVEDAWNELQGGWLRATGEPGLSGMCIDVRVGDEGLRFESATTISMEQSTAVPAVAVALMVLAGAGPDAGVWPPEVLNPRLFFDYASRVSPGGGGLKAYRLDALGQRGDRVPLRQLFESPTGKVSA